MLDDDVAQPVDDEPVEVDESTGPEVPGPVTSIPAELAPEPDAESPFVVESDTIPASEDPVETAAPDPPAVPPSDIIRSYSGLGAKQPTQSPKGKSRT